ncbi:hypothetical protein QFZ54_003735 [Sphingomonas faeni]|nr:hypothetical protein [Sphingomonas faeni]
MLFDDIGRRLPPGSYGDADRAVLRFYLDDQRPKHVDAEAAAALAIFGITAHRRSDMVVDPVLADLVVIIRAAAFCHESAYMLDLG